MVANRLAHSLARAMSTAIRRVSGLTSWAGAKVSRGFGLGGRGSGLSAVTKADSVAERPQRRLAWTSRLLLVAALAVPLLLLTIAAIVHAAPVPALSLALVDEIDLAVRSSAFADPAAIGASE